MSDVSASVKHRQARRRSSLDKSVMNAEALQSPMAESSPRVSNFRILGYALGEGAASITMNGVSNFALLYYTQVLGLGAGYAGLALSLATLWDAVTDPVMGHITDNTRTRWGRRFPYIVAGGLFLAASYWLLWTVPDGITSPQALFVFALAGNLLLRTAVTIFGVPYTALGFEICPGYEDRSRLQGIRAAFNMAINLVFGAFAWALFFHDGTSPDGARIDGTKIAENYARMGWVLAVATAVLILLCAWATRHTAKDNRNSRVQGNTLDDFRLDLLQILGDRLAWFVFGFFAIALFGMLLVSQLQMFVYVFFMKLPAGAKTWIHGGGMVAAGLGALFQAWLTKKTDKKIAGYIAMALTVFGGVFLTVVFFGFNLAPDASWHLAGTNIPVAYLLFGLGQACWWGGCGMLGPLAMSMVADLSEVNFLKTGILKDGGYSAVFTFLQKASMSAGLLLTGWMVTAAGIVANADAQTPEAVRNIALMTFLIGPALVIIAFFLLRRYPVDREYLVNLEKQSARDKDAARA
ncbi:MAG: MFS transporter [Chthoniobacterales bacterium]|nr:MFS transporter [Chthoniobacterales bacterium]